MKTQIIEIIDQLILKHSHQGLSDEDLESAKREVVIILEARISTINNLLK